MQRTVLNHNHPWLGTAADKTRVQSQNRSTYSFHFQILLQQGIFKVRYFFFSPNTFQGNSGV